MLETPGTSVEPRVAALDGSSSTSRVTGGPPPPPPPPHRRYLRNRNGPAGRAGCASRAPGRAAGRGRNGDRAARRRRRCAAGCRRPGSRGAASRRWPDRCRRPAPGRKPAPRSRPGRCRRRPPAEGRSARSAAAPEARPEPSKTSSSAPAGGAPARARRQTRMLPRQSAGRGRIRRSARCCHRHLPAVVPGIVCGTTFQSAKCSTPAFSCSQQAVALVCWRKVSLEILPVAVSAAGRPPAPRRASTRRRFCP